MSDTDDERAIEAVARAMIEVSGGDPDEKIMDDNGWLTPRWEIIRAQARMHVAAFRVCKALSL